MNICVSNLIRKSLIRSGVLPGKAVTVYGGVNLDTFENVPSEKTRQAREDYADRGVFTIGIVARFPSSAHFNPKNPTIKGHDVLFKALADLGEDVNLLVIGPWKEIDIESAKLLARYKGLDTDKITFCGYKEDIAPLYKIMDLNVLPSLNEGLGLSLIEAMAAGTPCIGANSGGIREIISDGVNGFLFGPGRSRDLEEKIRLILEREDLRSAFIARGRETVRELFDIEKNILETEKVFYGLLAS
jgi:glycosyltransferase involved in cell wall biosynthesis